MVSISVGSSNGSDKEPLRENIILDRNLFASKSVIDSLVKNSSSPSSESDAAYSKSFVF